MNGLNGQTNTTEPATTILVQSIASKVLSTLSRLEAAERRLNGGPPEIKNDGQASGEKIPQMTLVDRLSLLDKHAAQMDQVISRVEAVI